MNTCLAHPDRDAVAACSSCGADACAACEVRFRDASWCEACFAARFAPGAAVPPVPPQARPPAFSQARPVRSAALAVLLSFVVPGLGTLYCFGGPARRALVQFASWALGVWIFTHADGFFAFVMFFAVTAFWVWQMIDAYGTATLFNSLGRVPSEDEAAALGRGPFLVQDADSRSLGMALLVVGCVFLLVEVGGAIISGMHWLLPFGLIALGAWVIWRARRRPPMTAEGEAA